MHRHPTATLWLLAYSGLTAATHVAIIDERADWPNLRHSVLPGESLIDRARSRVASQFLQARDAGDVLLFVDADISWRDGDLSHIARRALERNAIVGGIYPKRTFGEGSAIRFAKDADGTWKIGEDSLIPCDYLGNGFIAYPRTVLAAIAETMHWVREGFWPIFLNMVVEAEHDGESGYEFLSEDWAACHRARALGFSVFASTLPHLVHHGSYSYRLIDARYRPPQDEEVTIERHSLSSAACAARKGMTNGTLQQAPRLASRPQ